MARCFGNLVVFSETIMVQWKRTHFGDVGLSSSKWRFFPLNHDYEDYTPEV